MTTHRCDVPHIYPMHTNQPSTLYIHDQPDVSIQSGGVIRVHGINVWMAAAQKHGQKWTNTYALEAA